MRIIGGTHRGRVLNPPMKKWPTRPTTDIAKEALFNILQNRIDLTKTKVLDLFGGSGGLSIECVSRGSEDVTFVDNYFGCVGWMKSIAKELEMEDYLTIIKSDVRKFLKYSNQKYDLIIADPPYALPWLRQLPSLIIDNEFLDDEGILVIEHGTNVSLGDHPAYIEQRKYGQSAFSFFE